MDDVIRYLKNNVRQYRLKHGLSQQKLAEQCGLSTFYISEIERGKKYPSLKTLIKLADIFNISVYMLLIDENSYQNKSIENFSTDLEDEISKVINKLKKKY